MLGDVGETVRALLPLVHAEGRPAGSSTRCSSKHRKADDRRRRRVHARRRAHTPIHPEYAAALLDEEAADDAVFTVDTGMCNVWAARYITPTAGAG